MRKKQAQKLAKNSFDFVEIVAACDIDPALWHETQWQQKVPMKESLP